MDADRKVELLGEAVRRVEHGTLLERVVGTAAEKLGVSGVAAALMSDADGGGVVAASSHVGRDLLELAFELGEGPSRDAVRGDTEILVDDLARHGPGRWPIYTVSARELGVEAVYAFPARLGAMRIGSLVAHRDRAGSLDETQLADARAFAELCSTLLIDHQAGLDSSAVVATGWPNRAVIHQATGMLSSQLDVPLAAALARLRAHAWSEGRLLEDLARDVVERRLRIEP